ncbi:hypothetical protein HYFRA_00013967 [Hymenoscyphus fraxineus]|uniref:2EXR domain-containing protein n=1 Tax=Hymenoscyphus fraxineus TaxID=746836 RepID=A0A9N9PP33_9HELO|nr:hypothetical protein HYFRA_00013967 [Hymenoscyphus fraxineus]
MAHSSHLPLNHKWWVDKPFHQFQRFASELQTMVWNLVIPDPRDVLSATIYYINYDLEHPKAVLHHPREVAEVAQSLYNMKREFSEGQHPSRPEYRAFVDLMNSALWSTMERDCDDEQLLDLFSNPVPDYNMMFFQVIRQILPIMQTCSGARAAVLDIYYLKPRKIHIQRLDKRMDLRWYSPSSPKPTSEEMMMSNQVGDFVRWADTDILYVPPQMDEARTWMMHNNLTNYEFDCQRIFLNIKHLSMYHASYIFVEPLASEYINFLHNFESLERVTMYFDPGRVGNKPNGTLVPHEPQEVPITTHITKNPRWADNPLPSDIVRHAKEQALDIENDFDFENSVVEEAEDRDGDFDYIGV